MVFFSVSRVVINLLLHDSVHTACIRQACMLYINVGADVCTTLQREPMIASACSKARDEYIFHISIANQWRRGR